MRSATLAAVNNPTGRPSASTTGSAGNPLERSCLSAASKLNPAASGASGWAMDSLTVDAAALSSVRVMGPCIAMGAAAAHALDLAGSGSVQQIDVAALRQRVRDNVERTD